MIKQLVPDVCARIIPGASYLSNHGLRRGFRSGDYAFFGKLLDDESVPGASFSILPVLAHDLGERRGPSRRCGD